MPDIDWPAVHAEALDILREYLRIDTTNPPGNEAPAARFLGGLLEAEGIPVEYVEIDPGREAVHARLGGDGSKRPFLLSNHLDVVPVEAAHWTKPPFEAVLEEGRVYGRGAIDMKGFGVMQLVALLTAKRQGLPLKRDLWFLGTPDEEAGSARGMGWIVEHRPDLVDVEFALNEGDSGRLSGGRTVFSVAANEKFGCPLRLVATGAGGHGSFIHTDNSMVRLAKALVRLDEWQRGLTFAPDTRAYVDRLAEAGILDGGTDEALAASIRARRGLTPMFMNTLNVTMVNAGVKRNVLPSRSEAILDCRLLPGQDTEEWRQQVAEVVADLEIAVEFVNDPQPTAMPRTEWDTELFHAIEASVRSVFEDAVVAPTMTIGATDNRFLRARGVVSYGFAPAVYSREENNGFHGNDEFISVETFNTGCELTYDIVRRLCT
ncbi:MAG: M20/M25/M40 family metallo-hydrolase [Dehalococcoidia bacterium]|nr:M20/M25/M40 family metallo-hydrolase [Dehalococcoidia bacterium]